MSDLHRAQADMEQIQERLAIINEELKGSIPFQIRIKRMAERAKLRTQLSAFEWLVNELRAG
ncbi:hypothetical protein [Xanthocytophaga flava]|uniref:hypothetical protein n=1 Tax=Xanthocytophaga flava TaxID=3048013 RepID=UPI0028D6315B|nr:hypothetical protein [Xanthocytophaga flavus]MDJ1468191.1 hypothetical protein [Xanthocytophaga flavus]